MRYKDQATSIFSEIADIIESSDNAENNIYDIVDFMIGIMTKDQLNQVEDMLTNQYPEDQRMIRKFISQVDGAEIEYQFNGENLEIRPAGCDWSDFIPEDKRAYSEPEYKELMSLLKVTLVPYILVLNMLVYPLE